MDPDTTMFDNSIPRTQNLESSELFRERKKLSSRGAHADNLTNLMKRPRYSLPLAYTLAVASKLVYEDTEVIRYELAKAGFDVERTFRPIAYHNICAFIVEKDNDILLVFRGTNPLNIGNYLTNVNIAMREVHAPWGSMGKVHKGFWEAMGDSQRNISPSTQTATVRIELTNTSLYLTIVSALYAVVKAIHFLTMNLFKHVAEPIDSSFLGHEADIRSRSMYAQAEKYIMTLIYPPPSKNGTKDKVNIADRISKDYGAVQRRKRLLIAGHSLGGALGTSKRVGIEWSAGARY
ncbi:hypothetical protein EC973_001780 [Apophysomyces ossiformis]|uniref:Fungal lipase-type domain-containing protein n=1 Tax=Apophysomyces ossiformis TaxID=679940 RepID=A0A8H7EP30_9FUNG|nr:hypothetical protein EC973_001780 [Apophysomyces ossiformis]